MYQVWLLGYALGIVLCMVAINTIGRNSFINLLAVACIPGVIVFVWSLLNDRRR